LSFEAILLANRFGQTLQQSTMFGKDPDDLCHLRSDACEAIRSLALEL
jgi:hypothetical protein